MSIQSNMIPNPKCPLCDDETYRVDANTVDIHETCLFVGPARKPSEESAFSAIVREMGTASTWIADASKAIEDGRVSPGEARGLLVSWRRLFAAARPLVESLSDLAGEAKAHAVPVDLDDLDNVGDADRFPPEDEGRPATSREELVIWSMMITGAAFFAGLLGLAWAFRGTLAGWGW
jgi:hypothetical protein